MRIIIANAIFWGGWIAGWIFHRPGGRHRGAPEEYLRLKWYAERRASTLRRRARSAPSPGWYLAHAAKWDARATEAATRYHAVRSAE